MFEIVQLILIRCITELGHKPKINNLCQYFLHENEKKKQHLGLFGFFVRQGSLLQHSENIG